MPSGPNEPWKSFVLKQRAVEADPNSADHPTNSNNSGNDCQSKSCFVTRAGGDEEPFSMIFRGVFDGPTWLSFNSTKMDDFKPEWFSAPRDVLPGTTIVPGRLVVNWSAPEGPPYLDKALAIPSEDLRTTNYKWSHEQEKERGASLGIFTSFMSGLAAGGDLSGNLTVGRGLKIEVERLQTSMFDPTDEYLEDTLQLPKNFAYLKDKSFLESLYMITSVKTAYGATLTRSRLKKWGGEGQFGFSPNVPGLEVGPKGGYSQRTTEEETIHDKTDFVFAFRLNRIHYSWIRKKYTQKKYVSGATYTEEELDSRGNIAQPKPVEEETDGEDALEVMGIREKPAGEEDFQVTGQTVVDEETGEICTIISPDHQAAGSVP